jgi:segregation and condensation protein B
MTHLTELIPHIESLIFASDKPLTSLEITDLINQAFGFMDEKISADQIDAAIEGIVEKYNSEFYPFEVKQSGGGWQFLTKKDYHKTVAQLNGEKFLKRLSAAALETLAIIAYKQPVTKGEIEAIRGVSSDYAVQKLLEKELIVISGRNEKLPGHPLVYATSKSFMDYFGINSAEDLPKIKEVLADQLIEPTIVNHTAFEQSDSLLVTDHGELVDAKAAAGEGYINGHTFETSDATDAPDETDLSDAVDGGDDNAFEEATEDLASEEAAEEAISDEIFIEGDEVEETQEVLNETANDFPASDETEELSQDNSSNDDTASDEAGKEEKE